MKLTDKELLDAIDLISKMSASSHYELQDIYRDRWVDVESPTTFGKRFKNSVLLGDLVGVEFVKIYSNNNSIYRKV